MISVKSITIKNLSLLSDTVINQRGRFFVLQFWRHNSSGNTDVYPWETTGNFMLSNHWYINQSINSLEQCEFYFENSVNIYDLIRSSSTFFALGFDYTFLIASIKEEKKR